MAVKRQKPKGRRFESCSRRLITMIRKMYEKDLSVVKKITKEVFNKSDAKKAIDTFLFHFKAKKIGIDDGRIYWVYIKKNAIVGFCGLHCIKKHFAVSWFGVKKRGFNQRGLERGY